MQIRMTESIPTQNYAQQQKFVAVWRPGSDTIEMIEKRPTSTAEESKKPQLRLRYVFTYQ